MKRTMVKQRFFLIFLTAVLFVLLTGCGQSAATGGWGGQGGWNRSDDGNSQGGKNRPDGTNRPGRQ